MKASTALSAGLALLLSAVIGVAIGHARAESQLGTFHAAVKALPAAQRQELEIAPVLTMANAAWALGNVDSVRRTSELALERIPESDGQRRARFYVRFGIIDDNPDGQAALFGQACAADARICDHMKDAAERETAARFVFPGNHLPLYFGGHPPIPGLSPP